MSKLTSGQKKWLAGLVILVVVAFLIGGCTPNHPPAIENLIITAEHRYLEETTSGFTTLKSVYKVMKGKDYKIECIASDPDGDELVFEWVADGGGVAGEGAVVTWTASSGGEITVTVTVSDGRGSVATESIVFAVVTCGCAFK